MDSPEHLIDGVLARMGERLEELERAGDPARHFLATYRRVTLAVGEAAAQGRVEDPSWLARWDVAFAELYLQAHDAWQQEPATVPGPWREAFSAPAGLEPYLHVLLGMNAHINFDMPQSLLQVVGERDRHDPVLMGSRERDHHALDGVIVALVPQESRHLVRAAAAAPGVLDRLLLPLSRAASARLLRESREQVWANTHVMLRARAAGPGPLAAATARLEELSTRRVHDLLVPRHPLYHLARHGFGVRLDGGAEDERVA
ncbi:DUF5995 family protein [Aquipuribacter hungaricus]|uniref:DUF5995 family protein n=1 Tax=Aquipuribacter hungaricus TaxID=545624 RepID=A0ABV7WAV1_9MICO